MTSAELLADAYKRIHELVHRAVEGLDGEQLATQPEPGTNPIAWLVWHLTRVQDDHIASAMGEEQLWVSGDWMGRFGFPFPAAATGRGHGPEELAIVGGAPVELLLGYQEAVHTRSLAYFTTLRDTDLDRIVDESWDPPVSLGIRLVSVLSDNLQHAGQALFVRGIIERR